MAKNFTNALLTELQRPEFIPFLDKWIESEIATAMEAGIADRVIELGKLRDLVAKQKKG